MKLIKYSKALSIIFLIEIINDLILSIKLLINSNKKFNWFFLINGFNHDFCGILPLHVRLSIMPHTVKGQFGKKIIYEYI